MVSTGIEDLDRILEGKGYPEKSAILLISPPGAGKAPLAYLFLKSGFSSSEEVICITFKPIEDLMNDMAVFGVSKEMPAHYIRCFADRPQFNLNNLTNLFLEIKKQIDAIVVGSKRIYIDIISALFLLHPPKIVYMFVTNFLQYLKEKGATVVASLDEGVVALDAQRSMEMIFDGAIEIKLVEDRFNIVPLMRIKKMLGLPPIFSYYRLAVSKGGVNLYDFNA